MKLINYKKSEWRKGKAFILLKGDNAKNIL